MDLQLDGKRALVTGSYRGTGEVIAERLAAEGVQVLVHGFEAGQAEAVARRIPGAEALTGDLFSDAGAERLWVAASASGPVDILVNN